jgi:hypothetical protein
VGHICTISSIAWENSEGMIEEIVVNHNYVHGICKGFFS